MPKSPEIERLKEAIEYLQKKDLIKSIRQLALILGMENAQSFYDVFKGRHNPTSKILKPLEEKYGISQSYIMFGKGDMLKDVNSDKDNKTDNEILYIPLLPLSAYGGSLNEFTMSVHQFECERILSPIKDAELAITIAGDSMAPEFPNGCQILIRKIDESAFIEWGRVYVLDTANGVVVKVINKGSDEGRIRCTSINPDQKRYEPFEVPTDCIFGFYKVLFVMAIK
jgi:phage repressor protein C with HTH and peptisase S24 domain